MISSETLPISSVAEEAKSIQRAEGKLSGSHLSWRKIAITLIEDRPPPYDRAPLEGMGDVIAILQACPGPMWMTYSGEGNKVIRR